MLFLNEIDMKIGNFMCVLIGGVLFLSQSFGLYAKGLDTPTVGVSTAELDGFNAKVKSVEMYESDFVSGVDLRVLCCGVSNMILWEGESSTVT